MADVRLTIASREYIVTCKDGEEQRLQALGSLVDSKAREAGGSAGGLNESRQLLFASLLLADQLYDAQPAETSASTATGGASDELADQMAETLDRLATRFESIVQGLEQRG
jgi:cell division protein ZapA